VPKPTPMPESLRSALRCDVFCGGDALRPRRFILLYNLPCEILQIRMARVFLHLRHKGPKLGAKGDLRYTEPPRPKSLHRGEQAGDTPWVIRCRYEGREASTLWGYLEVKLSRPTLFSFLHLLYLRHKCVPKLSLIYFHHVLCIRGSMIELRKNDLTIRFSQVNITPRWPPKNNREEIFVWRITKRCTTECSTP